LNYVLIFAILAFPSVPWPIPILPTQGRETGNQFGAFELQQSRPVRRQEGQRWVSNELGIILSLWQHSQETTGYRQGQKGENSGIGASVTLSSALVKLSRWDGDGDESPR
jgi:hypothetical protein